MSTAIIFLATASFVVLVSAQEPDQASRSGPVSLADPRPGAPLSFEQFEERVRLRPDGSVATTQVVKSRVYRDSTGRVRTESELPDLAGELSPVVNLVDPVGGFGVVLLTNEKIAYRVIVPAGHALGGPKVGEALPAGKWKTTTENLGNHTIDGIEYQGSRTTHTSEESGSVGATYEYWGSKELSLTGRAEASGPGWKHTAKVQNLERREPDRGLFVVPPDYAIVDLGAPN